MRTLRGKGRLAIAAALVATWATLTYACSTDDENPAVARNRDGGENSEGSVDPTNLPDAVVGAAICGKYGGYDKVKTIADAVLTRAQADCRISGGFALQGTDLDHLRECFEIQLGGAFECEGVSYVSNTTVDSKSKKCRDMTEAHKNLKLRNADFSAFADDIAQELAAQGVSQDDVRAVAPVFEGARSGVVTVTTQPDRDTYCACPDYQYDGKPCAVDGGVDAADASDAADAADG